jgi:hypothetical protein
MTIDLSTAEPKHWLAALAIAETWRSRGVTDTEVRQWLNYALSSGSVDTSLSSSTDSAKLFGPERLSAICAAALFLGDPRAIEAIQRVRSAWSPSCTQNISSTVST